MIQSALGPFFFDNMRNHKIFPTFSDKPTAFGNSQSQFAQVIAEITINDRFHKVIYELSLDAPKCSRTNAFLTWCIVVKHHQVLLMNFYTLRATVPKMRSKVAINDSFNKCLSMGISPCAFYC